MCIQTYVVSHAPPMHPIFNPSFGDFPATMIPVNANVGIGIDRTSINLSATFNDAPPDSLAYTTSRYQWPKV